MIPHSEAEMQQLLNEISEALIRAEEELLYAQNARQPENLPELAEVLERLGELAEYTQWPDGRN